MRIGLQGRYFIGLAVGLLLLGAVIVAGWRVQQQGFAELEQTSARSMAEQGREKLVRRGEAIATLLADALVNPVYFVDLQTIGQIARSALNQPDVEYVLVYDAQGRVLHDGTQDIAAFGQAMSDPFAMRAIAATALEVQIDATHVDVTQPMALGRERIGGVRVGLSRATTERAIEGAARALRADADAFAGRRLDALALPIAGVLLLALAGAVLVGRGLVKPIRALAAQALAVERGRHGVRLEAGAKRQDELGDLVRAFAHMSDSIMVHDRDVRRLAYLDTLTGLPNRLMLREQLARAILDGQTRGSALALLFVDIDDFKRINDTLGHDAGDEALAQLARRFETRLEGLRDPAVSRAESVDLIARFGGDEFVALIGGTDVRDRACRFAEGILECMREPLSAAGRPVFLNASIGITLFPDDALDAQQLLKNGDIAMYQAKVHGKNCYRFFTLYMTKIAEDRLSLEQDLRAAMSAGVLDVHYQPICDLGTERIAGAEALLRWNHPERGLVPSSLFVGIAEDFGLIEDLGRFALERACHDAVRWPDVDGEAPFVSWNLSVKQLRQPDLPAQIARVLRESGLPASRLHVELTESALLDDEPLGLSSLAELRRLGVKIWLDDFGTGFSGLSHLRRVPVDGVKVDRSFTQDLLTDRDDLALTSAIIAMAGSLGICAVAEGIESASQLEILRNLKCDLGQGYWLGYPMSQAEMLVTLANAPQRSAARA